jgi:hypothetical protein
MSVNNKPSVAARVLYRPVGLASSVAGGLVAGAIFKQVWKLAARSFGEHKQTDPPGALQTEYSFREILLAAALQGVIFSVVKTVIDRQGARMFERATGEWPGS